MDGELMRTAHQKNAHARFFTLTMWMFSMKIPEYQLVAEASSSE